MKQNRESIEVDIKKLEETVAWFESDEFVLEEAIDRYKEAEELAKSINQRLRELKHTVTEVTSD